MEPRERELKGEELSYDELRVALATPLGAEDCCLLVEGKSDGSCPLLDEKESPVLELGDK